MTEKQIIEKKLRAVIINYLIASFNEKHLLYDGSVLEPLSNEIFNAVIERTDSEAKKLSKSNG